MSVSSGAIIDQGEKTSHSVDVSLSEAAVERYGKDLLVTQARRNGFPAPFTPLSIPSVILIRPRRFGDARGWFMETWSRSVYAEGGIEADFVQDNQSFSAQVGTVRGLHFQAPPTPQAKLVRVVRGAIFDVAVDLRRSSPTYGQWCAATLTAEGGEQLFVPRGFAHGFATIEPDTEVAYKVDGPYDPACDRGLAWDDPDLSVAWPIAFDTAVLSAKDKAQPAFAGFQSPFA